MPQSSNLYSNLGSNLAERIRQKELIMQKTWFSLVHIRKQMLEEVYASIHTQNEAHAFFYSFHSMKTWSNFCRRGCDSHSTILMQELGPSSFNPMLCSRKCFLTQIFY
jgi:hypothetical protein